MVTPQTHTTITNMLQERVPFPGQERGHLSNTWKWIVGGDTCADKARDFIVVGRPGREQEDQKGCSATWLGFYGDGIDFQVVSGQSV